VLEWATVTHQLSGECVGANGLALMAARRRAMGGWCWLPGSACISEHNHEMCNRLLFFFWLACDGVHGMQNDV